MIADFSKKRKSDIFGNKILLQIAGILFLVITFVLIVANIKMYQKRKEVAVQLKNYRSQVEEIKKSSQNLKDEIANSKNQDYIEKILYEQFGENKPGENEVIFVQPLNKKTEPAVPADKFINAGFFSSWLSNAWQWIKNRF